MLLNLRFDLRIFFIVRGLLALVTALADVRRFGIEHVEDACLFEDICEAGDGVGFDTRGTEDWEEGRFE